MALPFAIAGVLRRVRTASLRRQILVMLVAAPAACMAHAAANFAIFDLFMQAENRK